MASGRSEIENLLLSPDIEAVIYGCQQLGARVERVGTTLYCEGIGGRVEGAQGPIDVGNSGLGLRFFTAIAALSSFPIVITGDASICHRRPSWPLMEALGQLGASVVSLEKEGFAPLRVWGPLLGGEADLEGSDSQPLSALLLAAPFAQRDVFLHVREAGERPYMEMTLSWLARLGLSYQRRGYEWFSLSAGQRLEAFHYRVPADFSTATFAAAAALITRSAVELLGLDFHEPQGDKAFFSIIENMGACVEREEDRVIVRSIGGLHGVTCDLNSAIDCLPILAVLAAYAEGKTRLFGVENARFKECDRLHCTASELKKLGVSIMVSEDALEIEGRGGLKGGAVSSHGDHRLAMALLVGGLGASGEIKVDEVRCIAKSYPTFFRDLL